MDASERGRAVRRGFTLVELMVSVGVLLLGVGVLIPTIDAAQRSARTVRCAGNLRLLMHGVRLYAAANNDALPGSPWTSGAHLRRREEFGDPSLVPAGLTASTRPTTRAGEPHGGHWTGAVALFDWYTPVAGSLGVKIAGGDLAGRTRGLMELRGFRCPEADVALPALPYPDATWPVVRAPSYTANLDFLLRPPAEGAAYLAGVVRPADSSGASPELSGADARLPLYYSPRLRVKNVGSPGEKVFLMDGRPGLVGAGDARAIRYPTDPVGLDNGGGLLRGGLSRGGLFATVRPYAREPLPDGRATNPMLAGSNADPALPPNWELGPTDDRDLSLLMIARHGTRRTGAPLNAYRLNLAFLDGHVETMAVMDAMKPGYHSPRGTVVAADPTTVFPRVMQRYLGAKGREYSVP